MTQEQPDKPVKYKQWYEIRMEIESIKRKINEKRSSYGQISTRVCLSDMVGYANAHPEMLSPAMHYDMACVTIVRARRLLLSRVDSRENQEMITALFNVRPDEFKYENYDTNFLKFSQNSLSYIYDELVPDANYGSGKNRLPGQVKSVLSELEKHKKSVVLKDFNPEELLLNVNVNDMPTTVTMKNFLAALNKYFPKAKKELAALNEQFVERVLNKKSQTTIQSDDDFKSAISFLNEGYNELLLKNVIKKAKEVPGYSYNKLKPTMDKLIKLYPGSEPFFEDYIKQAEAVDTNDVMEQPDTETINIKINLTALEKRLWKKWESGKKVQVTEISDKLKTNLKGIALKVGNNNPFSWIKAHHNYERTTKLEESVKVTEYILNFYVDIPKKELATVSLETAKKHYQEILLDYCDNYLVKDLLKENIYPVTQIWEDKAMRSLVDKAPELDVRKTMKF